MSIVLGGEVLELSTPAIALVPTERDREEARPSLLDVLKQLDERIESEKP